MGGRYPIPPAHQPFLERETAAIKLIQNDKDIDPYEMLAAVVWPTVEYPEAPPPATCSICSQPIKARGLCSSHYQKFWRKEASIS